MSSLTKLSGNLNDLGPFVLLQEWFDYWESTDSMPAKMPKGLHIRTAMALTIRTYAGGRIVLSGRARMNKCQRCDMDREEAKDFHCVDKYDKTYKRHSWTKMKTDYYNVDE